MPNQRRNLQVPPPDELDTLELATTLCHQLLPGATVRTPLDDNELEHTAAGVPRSWLIQAHKAARHRDPNDDTTVDAYIHYDDHELLASLSVKLDFDLNEIDTSPAGRPPRPVLVALYDGLRELDPASRPD
jgi:hypothetical protein